MPAPISVIIPTLNSETTLGPVLVALAEALTAGLLAEVILADGGSTDETEKIADEVGAVFLTTPKGRGGQMVAASAVAKGEWLLFLHSDSVLADGWTKPVIKHLNRSDAAYFKLNFDDPSQPARIVAHWANFRARVFGMPYGDQGLLIKRGLYDEIGGFADIPLMEDVDIARKLKGQLTPLPASITTSADKYRKAGWVRRSVRNFWAVTRFRMGADPAKLAKEYYR